MVCGTSLNFMVCGIPHMKNRVCNNATYLMRVWCWINNSRQVLRTNLAMGQPFRKCGLWLPSTVSKIWKWRQRQKAGSTSIVNFRWPRQTLSNHLTQAGTTFFKEVFSFHLFYPFLNRCLMFMWKVPGLGSLPGYLMAMVYLTLGLSLEFRGSKTGYIF